MTMQGYFLSGVDGETLLVFRSDDSEALLRVISRLAASRDKEIRGVANALELDWFKREYEKEKNGN